MTTTEYAQEQQAADARKVVDGLYKQNPNHQFAMTADGSCIGYWHPEKKRYVLCVSTTITHPRLFVHLDYECLINGKPPVPAHEWIPMPKERQEAAAG